MAEYNNGKPALPQGYQFAELATADREEIIKLHRWAFPTELSQDEMLMTPDTLNYPRSPGIRCTASGQLVAMHSSIAWEQLAVPGGSVKAAGLTWVETHPQHRRRGLLKAMIGQHFSRCQQRGEALSMLTASEAVIYGRYGYGMAAESLSLALSRGTMLRPVPGSEAVEISFADVVRDRDRDGGDRDCDRDCQVALVEGLHRAMGSQGKLARPGWATRDLPNYRRRMLFEQPRLRRGFEEPRLMLAHRDGQPVGFALFRRSDIWSTWDNGFGGIEVVVNEYGALDGAAAHALWSRLLDLDLTDRVRVSTLPVDDPLPGLLVDIGAAKPRLEDLLWVRLIDLRQALSARQYAADIDIVLELSDKLLLANQGRWQLKATAFSSNVEVCATDA